jgi:type IV pilus assembly protein PilY1
MKKLFTGFLTFLICLASQADDIEIYQGGATGVPNNVMFLMDTSRSMGQWVDIDIGIYDPTKTYPVALNGFDPETYYYHKTYDGDGSSDTETASIHERILNKAAINCKDAVTTIEEKGFIKGEFKRWDPIQNRWEAPGLLVTGLPHSSISEDAIWECKADERNHPSGKIINITGGSQYRNSYASWQLVSWTAYNAFWLDHVRRIFKGNYLNYQIFERGNNDHKNGEGNTAGIGVLDDQMSRMTITRAAAKTATESAFAQGRNINLGLARFDSEDSGGFIDLPIGPLLTQNEGTSNEIEGNKDLFNEKIDGYLPAARSLFESGRTPLSESYYEIALYYRGDPVYFGKNSHSIVLKDDKHVIDRYGDFNIVNVFSGNFFYGMFIPLPIPLIYPLSVTENARTILTPSVPESRVGDTYISPISNACQAKSVIVLFTDGVPVRDEEANPLIHDMISDNLTAQEISTFPGDLDPENCSGQGGCADELAYFLANFDQNENEVGDQVILTHVVGGFLSGANQNSITYLENIARHGGGKYFSGDNEEDIAAALNEIFSSTADAPTTFVAPALAVSSYNSLEHKNELYYAMFKPNNSGDWKGNLKQYALNENGLVVDANSLPIAGTDGNIFETARSFWTPSATPDGPNVLLGGAAQHLTKELKIFTHLTTGSGTLATTITDTPQIRALMQIPESMSSTDFTKISNWANRIDPYDVENGTRREMEDSLHSQPVVINYSASKSVVYMATNSGYLHAFKATKETNDFKEYFSYVPKELLPNIAAYANGTSLRKDELYGLDGYISYWFKDVNKNGQVDVNDGDHVILYIGMRRGGNHYYALDVTDPDEPKYLWQIDGGAGDFERLGQSWSEMTLAKVPFNNAERVVLLFGGGYDEDEDDATTASTNQLGNDIYMVDAEFGNLLWSASKAGPSFNGSDMTASFMNNIRLVDYNGDRITDFFYASDVAGRIWRFDIDKANTGDSNFADGGIIFDANGDSSDSIYNRFYNSPSVSYFKDKTGNGFLTLSIGTGFRASPLDLSSDDAFYVLKDYDIVHKPTTYTKRTPSDLAHYSVANDTLSNDDAANQKQGWKFTLAETSEKVLTNALTTNGRVIFTTFSPNSTPNPGTCSFDLGETKAYTINFQGGTDRKPIVEPPVCPTGGCAKVPTLVPPSLSTVPTCENLGTCPPNPEGCEDNDSCPEPTSCEDGGTVVLIGTVKLGNTISRCEILKKDYWMER